jgi:hypothetical protein
VGDSALPIIVTVAIGGPTLYLAWRAVVWARRGAVAAERQLTLAATDTTLLLGFYSDRGDLSDHIKTPSGKSVRLAATNLGGSMSQPGKVVITVGPAISAKPQGKWLPYARPNATMPGSSKAWQVDVGAIASNEKIHLPPITLTLPPGQSEAAYLDYTDMPPERLIRWEIWIEGRGANAGDLYPQVTP